MAYSTSRGVYRKIAPMPFISFEGSEGCGKSTQVQRLEAHLKREGIPASAFREPGGTAIGEAIRHLLQHSEDNRAMTAETELLLFEASRSQLVREKIQPALARRMWVICDRFFDSTTVYQGVARELDTAFLQKLNEFAVNNCTPDLTFVLDVDRRTALKRLGSRSDGELRDRMEEQPEEFYEQVSKAYRELAMSEPERVVLIDGAQSPDEIENEIWKTITARLPMTNSQSTNRSSNS